MIQKELYFSVPFYYKDISDSKRINKEIIENSIKLRKEYPKSLGRALELGWHSPDDIHKRDEFKEIVTQITNAQKEIFNNENYEKNSNPKITSMWVNISDKYSHHKNHIHTNNIWSGTYYVQTPKDCGRIWFNDPKTEAHMIDVYYENHNCNSYQHREIYWEPVEGRIIFFPSYMTHEVETNLSNLEGQDGWRISISFNFIQERN